MTSPQQKRNEFIRRTIREAAFASYMTGIEAGYLCAEKGMSLTETKFAAQQGWNKAEENHKNKDGDK